MPVLASGAILFGGWLLLFNPTEGQPRKPIAQWKKVREYDTAWLCEQGRRKEAMAAQQKATHPAGLFDVDQRYRCERVERVRK